MASIAQSMAGDHAAARRLLDEADATVAGLDYPAGRLAVVQARVSTGFFRADLGAVRSCADQIDDRVAQFYLLAAAGCHAARSGRARLGAQPTA
jgi:hypothetical protein